ncbi:peptide-methionine (S)-S-oxide reductase MsrA [Lacticaseibacillus baoqingensis]|uniref:Peptide methionine sulfoxide reductase MsrA n=1 Tax=Lacticaseibacillus baoqingensis TaxID=2486013 RepID=A0ABW4E9Y3_9LACO|nr:peptide-methionine (S)-S-oxide reductase MsrA [Lacticaseibacillus baoqingensis]
MLTTQQLITLLATPGVRTWERQQLQTALCLAQHDLKAAAQQLEAVLRPLAIRQNLSPDVADFYAGLIGQPVAYFDQAAHQAALAQYPHAIFAGGCFWCLVAPFEQLPGIISVASGYTGGRSAHPTYDEVHFGNSGHVEAVQIVFDPQQLTYAQLLALYWQLSDPTDNAGQLQDRGPMYRPVIFAANADQLHQAQRSKAQLAAQDPFGLPIVTAITMAQPFWLAENYHQRFYTKQPKRYAQIHRARQQLLWWKRWRGKLRHWRKT